jgi:hypothetical protein
MFQRFSFFFTSAFLSLVFFFFTTTTSFQVRFATFDGMIPPHTICITRRHESS